MSVDKWFHSAFIKSEDSGLWIHVELGGTGHPVYPGWWVHIHENSSRSLETQPWWGPTRKVQISRSGWGRNQSHAGNSDEQSSGPVEPAVQERGVQPAGAGGLSCPCLTAIVPAQGSSNPQWVFLLYPCLGLVQAYRPGVIVNSTHPLGSEVSRFG